MKKIAVYCDNLSGIGGSPRVVVELANSLNADIVTCGYDKRISNWLPVNNKIIDIGSLTHKIFPPFFYYFEAPLRFLLAKEYNYDINIFWGVSSFFAAKKGNTNLWYCHSPNRVMYDLRSWKLKNSSIVKKIFFMLHIKTFQKLDNLFVKNRITAIYSLTKTVKRRVKKYYNLDSQVIYSGLDISKYYYRKPHDYFLAVSRLTPEKRMDMIATAFTKMPLKKLILVGNGQDRNKIVSIIKNSKNIKILSDISDTKLARLYSECIAVVYVPKAEDFGLVPLEGMASGKISIASNEGGCMETVINDKTGYLITVSVENIIRACESLDIKKTISMKKYCIEWAKSFDKKNSNKHWRKIISSFQS